MDNSFARKRGKSSGEVDTAREE